KITYMLEEYIKKFIKPIKLYNKIKFKSIKCIVYPKSIFQIRLFISNNHHLIVRYNAEFEICVLEEYFNPCEENPIKKINLSNYLKHLCYRGFSFKYLRKVYKCIQENNIRVFEYPKKITINKKVKRQKNRIVEHIRIYSIEEIFSKLKKDEEEGKILH